MASSVEIIHLSADGKKIDPNNSNSDKLIPIDKTHVKTKKEDLLKAYEAKKPIFIEFYANWCGHCKTLAAEWEELVKTTKTDETIKNLVIASVESDVKEIDSALHVSVNGYPTIGAIVNKKFIPYNGERAHKAMLEFIKTKVLKTMSGGRKTGTSKTGTSKTQRSKTHRSKTHRSKTHRSKTHRSKTHRSKTCRSKTHRSKIYRGRRH